MELKVVVRLKVSTTLEKVASEKYSSNQPVGIDKASSGHHQQILQWAINNFCHHQHQVTSGQFHINKFASGCSTTKATVSRFQQTIVSNLDISKFASGHCTYFISGQRKFVIGHHQNFVNEQRMLIERKEQMDPFAAWRVMESSRKIQRWIKLAVDSCSLQIWVF